MSFYLPGRLTRTSPRRGARAPLVGVGTLFGVVFDEDARPFPVTAYAIESNGALISDATRVQQYIGAMWRTMNGFKFDQFISSTTAIGTVTTLQIAFYQSADGTVPNGPVPFVDSFIHSGINVVGKHTTNLGKTITIQPGGFYMLFGRDPSSAVGTSIRWDGWLTTDMRALSMTNASGFAPAGFAPSSYLTDIFVTDPAPATFDPTDKGALQGGGGNGAYLFPNVRMRVA